MKKKVPQIFSRVIFTRYTGNANYRTPKDVYEGLNKEFHFTFDPCPINSKPSKNGLTQNWGKRVFVNPPYSDPNVWVEKGLTEIKKGHSSVVVYLLKGDISTVLFHDLVMPYAQEIRVLRGRLKFSGLKDKKGKPVTGNSPFPSIIAVFRGAKVRSWKIPEMQVGKKEAKKWKLQKKVEKSKPKKRITKKKPVRKEHETPKGKSSERIDKIPEPEAVQELEAKILP